MPKTAYLWDELSDNVAAEYEDSVLSVAYTHEPGIHGNLLSQNRNGVTSYYHYDGKGDTVALTDDAGNVTDTKEYDAWGNVIASTGSTITAYQFGGELGNISDAAIRIIIARDQFYSTIAGRWVNKARLSRTRNSANPYAVFFQRGARKPNQQNRPVITTGEPVNFKATPGCDEVCREASQDLKARAGGGGPFCNCYIHERSIEPFCTPSPTKLCFKCACLFETDGIPLGTCPELDNCGMEHEISHLPRVDCNDAPLGVSEPNWPELADMIKTADEECRFRHKEALCIAEKLPKDKSSVCYGFMMMRIEKIKSDQQKPRFDCSDRQKLHPNFPNEGF